MKKNPKTGKKKITLKIVLKWFKNDLKAKKNWNSFPLCGFSSHFCYFNWLCWRGALCYMGNVSIQECEQPILTRRQNSQYLLSSWWSQLYMSQDQFITLWFEHFNLEDRYWGVDRVKTVKNVITFYSQWVLKICTTPESKRKLST